MSSEYSLIFSLFGFQFNIIYPSKKDSHSREPLEIFVILCFLITILQPSVSDKAADAES